MDINTAVSKLPITSSIPNFLSDSDRAVPKAPKIIGTITVLTLNCLLTSSAKSMCLTVFSSSISLTLIQGGLFGFCFGGGDKAGGGLGKIPPPPPPHLKLVAFILETSNLARKYTRTLSFRKYTF